jgi:hypothetical protein
MLPPIQRLIYAIGLPCFSAILHEPPEPSPRPQGSPETGDRVCNRSQANSARPRLILCRVCFAVELF